MLGSRFFNCTAKADESSWNGVGGGIVVLNSAAEVSDTTFERCSASVGGGMALTGSTATVGSSVFLDCVATYSGGGMSVEDAHATVDDGTNFTSCSAVGRVRAG